LRGRGMIVNKKRVARLMREDNLLALRGRRFVSTTQSDHDLEVHLNLAAAMTVTAVNQLWVADLTYIRLQREFIYLAVIIDAFSRRVVGWALDRTLQTRLPRAALECAVAERHPTTGLVHHSDRGVQYASEEYAELLDRHGIVASMSRPGNPYDNAMCESFMKTLKQEEIYCNRYPDLETLRNSIAEFIDEYYNRLRLHSALAYRTPEQAEADAAVSEARGRTPTVNMSFLRHQEIYQSDVAS
jgi:putative transposase